MIEPRPQILLPQNFVKSTHVVFLVEGVKSIVMSMSVCVSTRITQKPHDCLHRIFVNVAHGPGSSISGGNAISYVLPVLWMTSCFHTMGPVGQNQARRYV